MEVTWQDNIKMHPKGSGVAVWTGLIRIRTGWQTDANMVIQVCHQLTKRQKISLLAAVPLASQAGLSFKCSKFCIIWYIWRMGCADHMRKTLTET